MFFKFLEPKNAKKAAGGTTKRPLISKQIGIGNLDKTSNVENENIQSVDNQPVDNTVNQGELNSFEFEINLISTKVYHHFSFNEDEPRRKRSNGARANRSANQKQTTIASSNQTQATGSSNRTQTTGSNRQSSTASSNQQASTASSNQTQTIGSSNRTQTTGSNRQSSTASSNRTQTTASSNQQASTASSNRTQTTASSNRTQTTTSSNRQSSNAYALFDKMNIKSYQKEYSRIIDEDDEEDEDEIDPRYTNYESLNDPNDPQSDLFEPFEPFQPLQSSQQIPSDQTITVNSSDLIRSRQPPAKETSVKRKKGTLLERVAKKTNSFPMYRFVVPELGANLVRTERLIQSNVEQIAINVKQVQQNVSLEDCGRIISVVASRFPTLYEKNRTKDPSGVVSCFFINFRLLILIISSY